ncbi:MAG: succinate dehydrogenase, cytochrome b556 subunit [Pseudomonadota bacterium]
MAWTDKRPMSPHLQIYKLPMTAVLSVLHRGTGAALGVGGLLIVWILARAAGGEDDFAAANWVLSSLLGKLVLFGFTAALYYHFCNGIRHLLWDIGWGLDLKTSKHSGQAVLGVSLSLTALTWLVAL